MRNEENTPRRTSRQSANKIGTSAPKRAAAPVEEDVRTDRPRKKRRISFWGVLGTLVLTGVLTVAIFIGIFMSWINTLKGEVEVYLDEYETKVSTELYYQDTETEEWVMYQTLFMQGKDHIWVDGDEMPKYLRDAAEAIEDKRFRTHNGVDWIGTLRAIVFTLGPADSLQGGSTITQQLIKVVTEDNETTVRRKVVEIYRALEMETRYEKDDILTSYLNEIYLGQSCVGVEAGSLRYFGKHVSELSLAECASLISITNNPSMFGPWESEWARDNNRERQLLVLGAMLEQEKISQAEYDRAKAEEVVFTNGYTIFNNYVDNHLEDATEEEDAEPVAQSTAWNSYYTDAVIEDVAQALIEEFGLQPYTSIDKDTGEEKTHSAYEQAINMVYGEGYKIYTAQNYEYQEIAERVFEDVRNAPYTTGRDNEQLQGAITIMDPYTGYVVAMVGGVGPKTSDRNWNWATEVRPCGSAAKPISAYAPGLDAGTFTGASTFDDYPLMILDEDDPDSKPWPKNDNGKFVGLTTMRTALVRSLNTCAVRACSQHGPFNSYTFMTERLGFTTLTETDAQQTGNMALGGFERGVTTEEMTAAFASFVNEGIYTAPRTFVRVEDADGNVILDNTMESHVAMKPSTAAIMNSILSDVVTQGTGGAARFPGMHIAGKTGTTDDLRDRYFVGYTPYYAAACWVGYHSNSVIHSGGTNPAAVLWQKVMSQIHEGLEDKEFFSSSDVTRVTVCADSGMLATTLCESDVRGSRVRTELCAVDNQPTEMCSMHDGSSILNYTRQNFPDFPDVVAEDDQYVMLETPTLEEEPWGDVVEWFDKLFNPDGTLVNPPGDHDTDNETDDEVDDESSPDTPYDPDDFITPEE